MDGGKAFYIETKILSLRRTDSTAHIRMDAINKESISQYFNLLEQTMRSHNIQKSPNQIYNMDETGMPLSPHTPNIVTQNVQNKVHYRTSGKKSKLL